MSELNRVDTALLEVVAGMKDGRAEGAFNIRKDSGCAGRVNTENVTITTKTDKPGIDIRFVPGCKDTCHIPVIITVTKADTDIRARLESGASILNVACSTDTPRIVKKIRDAFPDVPIIASGGKTGESISATIAAGANAITYTPPSPAILFKEMMEKYRE